MNLAMAEKVKKGEALDVRKIGKPVAPGVFELREFVDDVDYCDFLMQDWIWSIGKRLNDGKIFAATDGRFYQNDAYKCLWLR